jgi:predicted DNA-binding transcriptional regulator AlpA
MSDPTKNPFDLLLDQIRAVVREEIALALSNGADRPAAEKERLLTPDEAAALIGVDKKWLYRHSKQFPFVRRLSKKNIRFNEAGLKRWLATRK